MKINDYSKKDFSNMLITDIKRKKNRLGSNQYENKRSWTKSTYLNLLIIPLLFGLCLGVKNLSESVTTTHAQEIISPIPHQPEDKIIHFGMDQSYDEGYSENKPTKTEIETYVREVFGKNAGAAFLLLSCENSTYNVEAVNHNYNDDGSLSSTDWGLFQLNDHFQGFNNDAKRFVYDYRINTLMAHKIFVDRGNTFDRWSCGQKLGI